MDKERQERFSTLVRAHSRAMFRLARSVVPTDHDAEDAVGEALVLAWKSFDTLREPEKGRAWLLRIALNCAYQQYRRRGQVIPLQEVEVGLAAPERDVEGCCDLWEAVRRLPADRRTVVVLFYYEDMTVEEIARTLEVAVGTVKSRLSRARVQLKKLLGEEKVV